MFSCVCACARQLARSPAAGLLHHRRRLRALRLQAGHNAGLAVTFDRLALVDTSCVIQQLISTNQMVWAPRGI